MNVTDPDPAPVLPQVSQQRSRWIGAVWGIPLAALIFVIYLAVDAVADRGIDVVVTFNTASGAKAGDTKVVYQGLVGGKVTKLALNPDGRHVDMTLRLVRRAEPALNTNTQFWLIGEKPDIADISSVKAALAGVAIGAAPGTGGTPTRKFIALDEAPVVMPGIPGTRYILHCEHLGTAKPGSSLFYRGQEIGKLTKVTLAEKNLFRIELFAFAPFDKLIGTDSVFWETSPISLGMSDHGFSADVEHPGALLTGGVETDRPRITASEQSPADTVFLLYRTREDAEAGPPGPGVPYTVHFSALAGRVMKGSSIRYLGYKVGEVISSVLKRDAASGESQVVVTADLYPKRFDLPVVDEREPMNIQRAAMDSALNQLLARGYRARLTQIPPLVGALSVSLSPDLATKKVVLGAGDLPDIPSVSGGAGLDDMTNQLSRILAKVDRVPIESIGEHVNGISSNLDRLVASPEVASSLSHLASTLAQADEMMSEVRPQVGPLVNKLNQAADELTGAAAGAKALLRPTSAGRTEASQWR